MKPGSNINANSLSTNWPGGRLWVRFLKVLAVLFLVERSEKAARL
jgi:hypothetical protein